MWHVQMALAEVCTQLTAILAVIVIVLSLDGP